MGPVPSYALASEPVCIPVTLICSVTGKIADLISIIWISK